MAQGIDLPVAPTVICRDCETLHPASPLRLSRRCPACGSPRLLDHPERDSLTIAHVDCDAFYATIEKRDCPELAAKPVIIGGGKRGVVSTACYIARTYGVRSAMPMFKALDLCPDAVVIKPNMEKYVAVGRQVRKLMQELTPLVEPISIDEAFLDLSGTQTLHRASPALTLVRFARRVEHDIGITVSVGLSTVKFLAKIASDLDKPRGFSIIGRAETLEFLGTKPVGILPGVGKVAREKLEAAGIRTIADLRRYDLAALYRIIGSDGARLRRLADGDDPRRVSVDGEAKSISAETTFDDDIGDADRLMPVLLRLCEKVALRLRKAEMATGGVTLKLKTHDFRLRTRSTSGLPPTQLTRRLFDAAQQLLRPELDGTRFRLIGIGANGLLPAQDADRGDLARPDTERDVHLEGAIDRLRDKFGSAAVTRGSVFADAARRASSKADKT